MSGISTPAALAALKTKLYKQFQASMTSTPVFAERVGLFLDVPSDTEFNTYDWLKAMSGMREWIGPRVYDGLTERVFQIWNRHYEKTLAVNRDKLEDSPMSAIGDASLRLGLLMDTARKLTDDLAVDLLQNGQSRLCYDGQNFFDTDHPVDIDDASAGTQSNYEGASFALTAPNFNTARQRMMSWKNENGRPFGNKMNLLVVPPALEDEGEVILVAQYGTSGQTNTNAGKAKLEVWPELAGQDTTWYGFDTQSPGAKALIRQLRKSLTLAARTSETDEPVFDRNEYVWGLDERVGMGFGAWSKAFKGVG